MKKRILALVLAVLTVLSMLPVYVFAETESELPTMVVPADSEAPMCNCPEGTDTTNGHVATCPCYTCPNCGAAEWHETCPEPEQHPDTGKMVKFLKSYPWAYQSHDDFVNNGKQLHANKFPALMRIAEVYIVGSSKVYKLETGDGSPWPAEFEGYYYIDSANVEIVEKCPICPEYGCTTEHVWCDSCEEYNCGIDHSAGGSENSCACCDACTGKEGCVCECGECDFCEKAEDPNVPSISATVMDANGNPVTDANGNPLVITVQGELPVGAMVSATVPVVGGEKLTGAFDIKVLNPDGTEWQPGPGESVTLTIPVAGIEDGKAVNVFHIIDHADAISENVKIIGISGAPDDVKFLLQDAITACGGDDCVAVEMFKDVIVQNGTISIQASSFSIYTYDEANREFDLAQDQLGIVEIPNLQSGNHGKRFKYYATVGSIFTLEPTFLGYGSYSLISENSSGVTLKVVSKESIWDYLQGNVVEVTLNDVSVGDTVTVRYLKEKSWLSDEDLYYVDIEIVREVKISYNANGKTAAMPASQTIATDGTIEYTVAAAPSAENLTFKGWNTNNAGTGAWYQPGAVIVPVADMTLYAIWEEDKYDVKFDPNGGSGTVTTVVVDHGKEFVFPDAPVRENYTFLGWCASKNGDGTRFAAGSKTSVTSSATYYAIWGADLTITISGNISEIMMMESTEFDWKNIPSGYFSQAGQSYNREDVEGFLKGVTFRIKAAGDSNFNANNAYTSTGAAVTFWTEDDGKTLYVQLPNGVTVDTTITITTEKDKYSVSYVPNGGSAVEPDLNISSGSSINLDNKKTTREGYSFDGWYSDAALTHKVTGKVTITTHTTFYAKWNVNDFAITYNLDGGSLATGVTNPESYNAETDDFTLNNPVKNGYTFAGWTGTGLDKPTVTVTVSEGSTGKRNYTATWTENKTTLYYVAVGPDGVTNFGTVTQASEEIFAVTGTPAGSVAQAGTGFIFKGWYSNAACTKQVGTDAEFVPSKAADTIWTETTYYAKFDYGYADLTISTTCSDENQSFVITIRNDGQTVTGENVNLQVVLTGTDTVTIKHLPFGTYTVEEAGWSWRYNNQSTEITIVPNTAAQVTFDYAAVANGFWLSGDSWFRKPWNGTVTSSDKPTNN